MNAEIYSSILYELIDRIINIFNIKYPEGMKNDLEKMPFFIVDALITEGKYAEFGRLSIERIELKAIANKLIDIDKEEQSVEWYEANNKWNDVYNRGDDLKMELNKLRTERSKL